MLCRLCFFVFTRALLLNLIGLFFNFFRLCVSLRFNIFVSFVFLNFCMSFLSTLSLPVYTRL
ncbi:hypothetical protein BZA70DRAFT_271053 [Myxozyma melibiosi]|uniref:Uncharacterized protein n=1 Tax=Myxozyma melibiosi TaxID=54550 RepID=A0ABR1FBX4_9ASCO